MLRDSLCFKLSLMLFFTIAYSFSQSIKEADSIESIINDYGKPDENYVRLRNSYVAKKMFLSPNDSTWLSYNLETLKVAKALDYKEGQILSYSNIAVVYQYIFSDPYTAVDYYLKSQFIIDQNDNLEAYNIPTQHNIALLYYEQDEFDKAMPYLQKTLKKIKTHHNKKGIVKNVAFTYEASILLNLGNAYEKLKQLDSAIYYYENCCILSSKIKNHNILANAKSGMGIALSKSGKKEEAKQYAEESINLVDAYNLEFIRPLIYINAAEVYLESSNHNLAKTYIDKTLRLNKSLKNLSIESSTWETLAKINYALQDYKAAFDALKKFTTLKDTLTSTDRKLEISRKEIQYEADKKELLANAEIKRQKNLKNFSIIVGVFLLMAFTTGSIYYKKRRDYLFNLKVATTELKALRAQMNPHFIFSCLTSINNLIHNNKNDDANLYLQKFSKLMRKTLENSLREFILLSDDLDLIKTFLDIEKKVIEGGFDYKVMVDDSINKKTTLIPPMLLQPLVENSIKHGVAYTNGAGIVKIKVFKKQSMLCCTVEDNGRSVNNRKGSQIKTLSISTKIINNRLDIINAKHKTNARYKITSNIDGTTAELLLPLLNEF